MAIAALMGVGTAVKGEEVPSLDLNFNGQASSYTRATTSPTAAKANGDQLATDIVTQNKSGTVQSMYMGPDGKLVTGYRENLLTYSSIASWTQGTNMSVTASSVTDPLGGTGAYRIDDQDNVNWRSMDIAASVAANTWATLSVYIHASDNSSTMIGFNINYSGGVTLPRLTIVNGVPSTPSNHQTGHSSYTGTVTQVAGTDWYRWEIPFDFGVTSISFYPAMATASSTGYATVFGAQLELGGAAFQLVQTSGATVAAQVPRLEYDASGNPLGLLVEESRTNLLYPSAFPTGASGVWSAPSQSTAAVNATGPDGTNSAATLTANSTVTADVRWRSTVNQLTSTTYTLSFFAKAGTSPYVYARNLANSNVFVWWDVTDFSVSDAGTNVTASGSVPVGNGWYRCYMTAPTAATIANNLVDIGIVYSSGSLSDASTAGLTGIFYGAQLEAGEGPTSYIPTSGATATRAADEIALATSAFGYNTAAGTALADFSMQSDTDQGYPGVFTFIDEVATGLPRDILYLASPNDDLNMFSSESSTDTNWTLEAGVSFPLSRSVAVRINGTSGQDAIDGTLSTPQTINVAPSTTRDTLYVGSNGSTNPMNGHIRRFTYWPRAINDAQLSKFTNQ